MGNLQDYRRILARMGYGEYQNSLLGRFLEQDGKWDSHLEKCRNFIIKCVEICNPETVTILGSGWLLDVPLAELAEKCRAVRLVDIVHPPELRSQIAEMHNVTLIEDDVTGGIAGKVWDFAGKKGLFKKKQPLSELIIPDYKPAFDPGMVISMNLLTQLESMPVRYLKKQAHFNDYEILLFRKSIQEAHLRFLKKYCSVLITDITEFVTRRSGEKDEIPGLLVGLPDAKLSDEWVWDFDLGGSDFYNRRSIMKMKAILI